jgi:hypothetical protein
MVYLPDMESFLCSLLFCDIVILCVTVFFVYCTVHCPCILLSACDVRAATLRFFRAFYSVVRQMPGYKSQRRGTARISQISYFFYCYVCLIC